MFKKKKLTKENPTVYFLPMGKKVPIHQAKTVLEVALLHHIDIPHSCGGMGSCTTCRVILESPCHSLPDRSSIEKDIAQERNYTEKERLACQLPPLPDMKIIIPSSSLFSCD